MCFKAVLELGPHSTSPSFDVVATTLMERHIGSIWSTTGSDAPSGCRALMELTCLESVTAARPFQTWAAAAVTCLCEPDEVGLSVRSQHGGCLCITADTAVQLVRHAPLGLHLLPTPQPSVQHSCARLVGNYGFATKLEEGTTCKATVLQQGTPPTLSIQKGARRPLSRAGSYPTRAAASKSGRLSTPSTSDKLCVSSKASPPTAQLTTRAVGGVFSPA